MTFHGYRRRLSNDHSNLARRAFVFVALLGCSIPALAQPTAARQAPQRIISTAPSITEALYAMGLEDRIVAVDRFSRYPPEAADKPSIGDYAAPNFEVIASFQPDVVMIPANPVQLKQRLEALKLNVLELDQDGLAKLYASYETLGEITGERDAARALIASIRDPLAEIGKQIAGLPRTRVMFVVGRTPNRLDGLIVVGGDSYLNEVISLAGGENIFRDASTAYPQVSLEEVLARNPDVIVDMGDMSDTVGVTDQRMRSVEQLWGRMSSLSAVKGRRVHAIASDIYVVPGPRMVNAVLEFARMLHPDASIDLADGTLGGNR